MSERGRPSMLILPTTSNSGNTQMPPTTGRERREGLVPTIRVRLGTSMIINLTLRSSISISRHVRGMYRAIISNRRRKPYYQKIKGEDISLNVSITFQESLFGIVKEVPIDKIQVCTSCSGSRKSANGDSQKCYTCGGMGSYRYRNGDEDVKCAECDGWGILIKDPCKACDGAGVCMTHSVERISIPRPVEHGQLLRK